MISLKQLLLEVNLKKIIYYGITSDLHIYFFGKGTYDAKETIKTFNFTFDGMSRWWISRNKYSVSELKSQLPIILDTLKNQGFQPEPKKNLDKKYIIPGFSKRTKLTIPSGGGKNIIYSRGYPYGAPMIFLRGGGVKKIKDVLRFDYGFELDRTGYGFL